MTRIYNDEIFSQPCTKCGNVFPATVDYFRSSKTHKFSIQKECIDCSNKRTGQSSKRLREKGLHALQMGGSRARRWLVCSPLCLGVITREQIKANSNYWEKRTSIIADNMRNPRRLLETTNKMQKRHKLDTSSAQLERWEACLRNYVQPIMLTKYKSASRIVWETKFHSIYLSLLKHTRSRTNG